MCFSTFQADIRYVYPSTLWNFTCRENLNLLDKDGMSQRIPCHKYSLPNLLHCCMLITAFVCRKFRMRYQNLKTWDLACRHKVCCQETKPKGPTIIIVMAQHCNLSSQSNEVRNSPRREHKTNYNQYQMAIGSEGILADNTLLQRKYNLNILFWKILNSVKYFRN